MSNIKEITGSYQYGGGKLVILASRFNDFIVDQLIKGATDCLIRHGVKIQDLSLVRTPGAFEMPLVAQKLAEKGGINAIIALGAVIRGATPHFDYVAGECTKGLAAVSLRFSVPIANGVLTVDTIEQAVERAGTKAGNKGADAAMTALEMVSLLQQL